MKFELGPGLKCDLAVLMESRLLIQAQSGGGKSRTLRRLLEQTHGKVQQIVIDPEGEFSTLREKFDYVLAAGSGGDALAHPRTAAMLAERLLELQVSAVVDLYELKPRLRIEFVKLFFEALIEAPKRLRHPCLVAIDEAQMFAPEGGQAESAAAVADMAVRGRKRGLCLIAAVARLSEFDKATAAPLLNKLIGLTSLDLDMKRAAQDLGFDKAGMLGLRNLEGMQFWGFGPALVRAPTLVTIGDHVTTHLRPGARLTAVVPPPTAKIKALLPQLADLPAEAEQKQRTEAELKKDLAAARATITRLERAAPARVETKTETKIEQVKVAVVKDGQLQRLERLAAQLTETLNPSDWLKTVVLPQLAPLVREFAAAVAAVKQPAPVPAAAKPAARAELPRRHVELTRTGGWDPARPRDPDPTLDGGTSLKAGARRMLEQLAIWHPRGLARSELGVLAGVQSSGGTFSDYLSALRKNGFIEERGPIISVTDSGLAAAGDVRHPHSTEEILAIYQSKLKAGARRMLDILVARYPDGINRRELGAESGVDASGGTFSDYLSSLRSAGLLDESQGDLRAAAILFPEVAA